MNHSAHYPHHSYPQSSTASPNSTHGSLSALSLQPPAVRKRPRDPPAAEDALPSAAKRVRSAPEEPSVYSENVRKKLAATTRTGQACDRCKERKMKCDPDPIACQPCRLKALPCFTTDRVTGQSRERGQSDRTETEIESLRSQLLEYQRRYGPLATLEPAKHPDPPPLLPDAARKSSLSEPVHENDAASSARRPRPSPQYVGWPPANDATAIYPSTMRGMRLDLLDWGIVDIGDFECELMQDPPANGQPCFNFSAASVVKTINHQQRIQDHELKLLPKAEAVEYADTYLKVMWCFVPIVHKPHFSDQVHRLYDEPHLLSLPQKLQVIQMLAVTLHQNAIRNHAQFHRINDAYQYTHYVLGFYHHLMQDPSIEAMQALAMLLIILRNLPKPGYTWRIAQEVLMRAIQLDYHRDPDRIELPPRDNNALAKELRKRVFHCILGICVTTGCRLGAPSPWQFGHWDVPLPLAILDDEVSSLGLKPQRSGRCEYWPCLQFAKLLPLYTELYNDLLSVRRSSDDYAHVVATLQFKIDAWRADWDESRVGEDRTSIADVVATLLIDSWAAELLLHLHHPRLCPDKSTEAVEENLEKCHKAAKRLLTNFHTLSKKYKAADFAWHSVVSYVLGFGMTLNHCKRRTTNITQERFDAMRNELAGWQNLMAYADLVLRTGNALVPKFKPLVEDVLRHVESYILSPVATRPAPPTTTRSYSSVKQENSPQSSLVHRTPPEFTTVNSRAHSAVFANHHQQPYVVEQTTTLPQTTHSMYGPAIIHYPNVPTSLAPLLNETPPTTVSQYRPTGVPQDPEMAFSPHLYTDATAVWPLIPHGGVY